MINWSRRAKVALSYLFRPLQDIDIYVEDINDEVFYSELIRHIAPSHIRVVRVFPKGGRQAVLKAARCHDFQQRRALFLVDGDFEWVRGENPPAVHGVYRIEAYCIENLLIHEMPAVQITIEEAGLNETTAKRTLAFHTWIQQVSSALVPLFISFAALNLVNPDEATTSLGIGSILTARKKGKWPELDAAKIAAVTAEADRKLEALVGISRSEEIRATLRERVNQLAEPVRIVSGKDFLLPLLDFRLHACKAICRREALRIRMARHSDRTRFAELSRAIESAAGN